MKMFGDYTEMLKNRFDVIDGVSPWMWVAQDDGAWTGPKADWEQQHKQVWLKHVKNFDVVVQAGGNCGLYPRLLANHFKRVYTFEPDPLNFHCLVNNNQLNNVFKFQAALGSEHRLISVARGGFSNVGTHTVSDNLDLEISHVPMVTLDSFNLDKCDFIQLDVENYEPSVLKGASLTINKYRPVITCENGHVEGVMSIMNNLGYKVADKSGADTLFVPE